MRDNHHKPKPFLRNATQFLRLRRKPPSPSTMTQGAPSTPPNPQWQSPFFTTLPPELRILIYNELARDTLPVVHILKKKEKKIEFVKCRGEICEMLYNNKCQPNSGGSGAADRMSLLPFLLSCRKAYVTHSSHFIVMVVLIDGAHSSNIEANPALYAATIFDFRSFPAYLLASTLLPTRTFSSICSIHLKYHFGYMLWFKDPDLHCQRPRENPVWNQVWKIMKGMELRSVVVDLEACLEGGRVERDVEREVLEPLGAVSVRGGEEGAFVVRVTWEGDSEEEVEEGLETRTFRLVRVG